MPRFESRIGRFLELEIEDAALAKVEGTLDGAHVGKPHMPDLGWIDIVTRSAIREGAELTVDYAAMELDTVSSAQCCCGAANCRVRIAGFRRLSVELQQAYLAEGIIPAYLRNAAGMSAPRR